MERWAGVSKKTLPTLFPLSPPTFTSLYHTPNSSQCKESKRGRGQKAVNSSRLCFKNNKQTTLQLCGLKSEYLCQIFFSLFLIYFSPGSCSFFSLSTFQTGNGRISFCPEKQIRASSCECSCCLLKVNKSHFLFFFFLFFKPVTVAAAAIYLAKGKLRPRFR